MKKMSLFFGFAAAMGVAAMVLMAACEKADPPEDFEVEIEENEAFISSYKGKSLSPRIPSKIKGKKVTRILNGAFFSDDLTGVTIPESVTEIGDRTFAANKLTTVTIPKGVTEIGEEAFYSNQLTSVTIPDGVERIRDRAFAGNQLASVTIPGNVKEIGHDAFADNKLTSVTIPEGVKQVGQNAFSGNELASVTIGAKVSLLPGNGNGFDEAYYLNDMKAGTYTLSNGKWAYQQ